LDLKTYLEAISVVVLAIGCAVLGAMMKIDFLTTVVAPGLFGIAAGYLGHATKVAMVGK
jgi:hypothetical protein